MSVNVQLSIKEIYEQLCPKCKVKLRKLLKDKLTDKLVEQVIS